VSEPYDCKTIKLIYTEFTVTLSEVVLMGLFSLVKFKNYFEFKIRMVEETIISSENITRSSREGGRR
jgi:hypothetical protein